MSFRAIGPHRCDILFPRTRDYNNISILEKIEREKNESREKSGTINLRKKNFEVYISRLLGKSKHVANVKKKKEYSVERVRDKRKNKRGDVTKRRQLK